MLIDINNMKIKGILHIGGHYGQEYLLYKSKNIQNIMFFEPVPSNFAILKERLEGKAILVNKAVGAESRKIEMFIETANRSMSCSILQPKLHLEEYPKIIFTSKIEVDMIKLDEIYIDKKKYNMLVVDVQGYELEVFKGAKILLKNIDYIVTEVNRKELYTNNPLIEDIDIFLGQHKFLRTDTKWMSKGWGDALYVKQIKLA